MLAGRASTNTIHPFTYIELADAPETLYSPEDPGSHIGSVQRRPAASELCARSVWEWLADGILGA